MGWKIEGGVVEIYAMCSTVWLDVRNYKVITLSV